MYICLTHHTRDTHHNIKHYKTCIIQEEKDVHLWSTQTYHKHSLQACTAQWPNSYLSQIYSVIKSESCTWLKQNKLKFTLLNLKANLRYQFNEHLLSAYSDKMSRGTDNLLIMPFFFVHVLQRSHKNVK